MELTLIRHMQTPYNAKGILQGRMDIGILPPGPEEKQKIKANKKQLGDLSNFNHILVSSLKRTHQTAKFYTRNFVIDPLMDELNFGPYEGKPRTKLYSEQPLWEECPGQLVLGEPVSALEKRVKAFIDKYRTWDRVLAFGHGAWIRALISLHTHGSLEFMNRLYISNNEMMQFIF